MRGVIVRNPLLAFFVLAYFLSWICWVPLTFGEGWDQELVSLIMLLGVLGPMGAAILVSSATKQKRLFWQSTLKVKVEPLWYLVTLGIPLVVLFILIGVDRFLGVPAEASAMHTTEFVPWYMYPLMLVFMMLVGGGLEEPGWRGFAQSRLLARFTPFTASLILGVVWTYWHTPLMWVPGSSQVGIELGWYTLGVTSLAIILTWLFIKSGGSAFLAIVFHGGVNAVNSWIPAFSLPIGNLTLSGFAVMESVYAVIAVFILILEKDLFFKRFKSQDPLLVTQ